YVWFFPGGTPATSEEPNPVVSYAAPGRYDVALQVIRSIDGQEEESTTVKHGYIHVIDARTPIPATVQNTPEGFQVTVPPASWGLENPDSIRTDSVNYSWRMHTQQPGAVNGAGGFGQSTAAAVFPGHFYSDYGQRDAMITGRYDGRNSVGVGVAFSYAYAPLYFERDNPVVLAIRRLYADTLNVYYSTDCGETWELAWSKGGMQLNTADPSYDHSLLQVFVPKRHEWRRDTVRLPKADRKAFIRLKFEAVAGWGNHIYLDDVNVQAFFRCDTCCNAACCVDTCNVNRSEVSSSLGQPKIYPNPAKGRIQAEFFLPFADEPQIELINVYGVRVAWREKEYFPAGNAKLTWDLPPLPAGIYILTFKPRNLSPVSAKITVLGD
ncbi:MAG: T9SS type A sorting domain-containing protein, partial [Bacteroidia bacterium]|nr:T9SS type A sorting domain-containing protein [Bacteroidia bacterium]MDW8334924.1 T9SS type A sorting domain-containing protein [Bacteroidia bacterium]